MLICSFIPHRNLCRFYSVDKDVGEHYILQIDFKKRIRVHGNGEVLLTSTVRDSTGDQK